MSIDNLQISAIRKVPSPSIMINCSTTGLPPTSILWTRGSAQLVNNQVYQLSQFPSDRATSTYSNLLTINQTLQNLKGIYRFAATSEQTATNQSSTSPNNGIGKEQLYYLTIQQPNDKKETRPFFVLIGGSRTFRSIFPYQH